MSVNEHEPTSSIGWIRTLLRERNRPIKHEEKKIFQSTYKLEKQFLPRNDETLEKAFMRKIQEISYESSRFRDVLTIMGIEISRNDIIKFFKMTTKSFKLTRISKVQAALGKFHLRNS